MGDTPASVPASPAARAAAAYLGLAIGDALGATVEFMTPREIVAQYGRHDSIRGGGWLRLKSGQVTDDTTMALALGRSILDHGEVCAEAAAAALSLGVGLAGLAGVNIGVAAVGWIAVLAHQRRRYPDLTWGIAFPRGEDARALVTTAPFYAAIPAAMALTVHGTVVLIAGLAGAGAAVVGYTTLRTLTGMARTVTEQIAHVAGAEFARQYAQEDIEALQRLYRFTGRLAGGMTGGLAGMIAVIGPPFLGIWTLGHVAFAPGVFWPLLAAVGMLTAASGAMLHHLWIVLLGGAVLLFAIYRWAFEPFEA